MADLGQRGRGASTRRPVSTRPSWPAGPACVRDIDGLSDLGKLRASQPCQSRDRVLACALRTGRPDVITAPSSSTLAAVDATNDRAPGRIRYSASVPHPGGPNFIDPLAGQLALAGTSSIMRPFEVKRSVSAPLVTKEAALQAFSSRRPDSNRRHLHYEAFGLATTEILPLQRQGVADAA